MAEVEIVRHEAHLDLTRVAREGLCNDLGTYYFGVDTVLLLPNDTNVHWPHWVRFKEKNLTGLAEYIAIETRAHRIHRLLPLKEPSEIKNNFQREQYREKIKAFLHYHLWHGVVLYPIFLSEKHYDFREIIANLDMAIVGHGKAVDISGIWLSGFNGAKTLSKTESLEHIQSRLSLLRRTDLRKAVQLWYDEGTFARGERKRDKLYTNCREFVHRLYGGRCQAKECDSPMRRMQIRHSRLDHIIPKVLANHVLINLQLLCERCNTNKSNMNTFELPFERAYSTLPAEVRTDHMKTIMSDSPPDWIQAGRCSGRPINIFKFLKT